MKMQPMANGPLKMRREKDYSQKSSNWKAQRKKEIKRMEKLMRKEEKVA
jgi:hypothetical protein